MERERSAFCEFSDRADHARSGNTEPITREGKEITYNTTADSASLVRGDQEVWKTNSLTWLRTTSQRPEKDQRWVEGVLSSWEEDMEEDEEEGRR